MLARKVPNIYDFAYQLAGSFIYETSAPTTMFPPKPYYLLKEESSKGTE